MPNKWIKTCKHILERLKLNPLDEDLNTTLEAKLNCNSLKTVFLVFDTFLRYSSDDGHIKRKLSVKLRFLIFI